MEHQNNNPEEQPQLNSAISTCEQEDPTIETCPQADQPSEVPSVTAEEEIPVVQEEKASNSSTSGEYPAKTVTEGARPVEGQDGKSDEFLESDIEEENEEEDQGDEDQQDGQRFFRSRRGSSDLFSLFQDEDDEEGLSIPETLPLLPLKDTVIYPASVQPLSVGQERSIRLVDDAMRADRLIVLVAQKNEEVDHPKQEDIFHVGTVARIGRLFRMPDGSVQLAVQGLDRVDISEITQEKPYYMARVALRPDTQEDDKETEAIKRNVINSFQRLVSLIQNVPDGVAAVTLNLESPRQVAYVIASFIQMEIGLRQKLLEIDSVRKKLEELSVFLAKELELLELGKQIQISAQEKMGKMQRDIMLREQLEAIQRELGEGNEEQAAVSELLQKIEDAKMPEEALKDARRELSRLEKLPTISPEYSIIRTYIELLVSLPWSKSTATRIDVSYAREVLDHDHYDLEKIKERILEYLAVRRLKEDRQAEQLARLQEEEKAVKEAAAARESSEKENEAGEEAEKENHSQPLPNLPPEQSLHREPILCFVGPPGVGKTSLGQSIARTLGRKFARMSLGGIRDEAEIRGHRRTYIGAMPGRIIQTLRRVETNDPVIMLDEVDKVGADWRGDPSSALLEVLDPEQNYNFRDNYLDLPFDLSKVMFIATANSLEPIPAPLRDRMEILELSGYTQEQKIHIARRYLLPKQLEANGLTKDELILDDEVLRAIARDYTREAGVRNLEREIGNLCRKVARQISEGRATPVQIVANNLSEYLGRQRYFEEAAERIDRPGIATGMVWTPVGGEIIFIEAATMPGKEERLILTGQLGDVMKESAMAALSYVRSNAEQLGLPKHVFEEQNVHIHVPAGAIPKDGPSAGVTMVSVLVSLASNRKVRSDVAMTGEITLRGKVMPVGGLKEKVLAAYRSGIRTVIMPEKSQAELEEDLPKEMRDEMKFVFVNDIRQVLETALEPATLADETLQSLPEEKLSCNAAVPR